MKVRKLIWPLSVVSFFAVACEDKNEAPEAESAAAGKAVAGAKPGDAPAPPAPPAAAPTAAKPAPAPGPQEVCGALTAAAKAKDDAKLLETSTAATQAALAADGAKDHLMTILAQANCGIAKTDGDAATVTLGGTEKPYEATFIKGAGGYKFDGAAFLAKYPPALHAKGKKAAGHDKAKKAHGKHKGH